MSDADAVLGALLPCWSGVLRAVDREMQWHTRGPQSSRSKVMRGFARRLETWERDGWGQMYGDFVNRHVRIPRDAVMVVAAALRDTADRQQEDR